MSSVNASAFSPIQNSFIVAAAGRARAEEKRTGRDENNPREWIGVWASFEERMLFEWSLLALRFEDAGDIATAEYARGRAATLRTQMGGY